MPVPPKLTPEQIAAARIAHNIGDTYAKIGRDLGVDGSTVKRALDLEWADKRRRQINEKRAQQRREGPSYTPPRVRPTNEEFRARQKLIPPDTRDLTGRLLGDPIPNDPRRKPVDSGSLQLTKSRPSVMP